MPGGNGTGPLGQGSMTGRGLGYCNPSANNFAATNNAQVSKEDRKAILEKQLTNIQNELDSMK
jgi:hypothetical protein